MKILLKFLIAINLLLAMATFTVKWLQIDSTVFVSETIVEIEIQSLEIETYDEKTIQCSPAKWKENVSLFLPVPPTADAMNELARLSLKSMSIFWPVENLNLNLITEATSVNDPGAIALKMLAQEILPAGSRIDISLTLSNKWTLQGGWNKQQWLMFWADKYDDAEFIGFLDSDTVFITRIFNRDLFNNGKPIVRAHYGQAPNEFWQSVHKSSEFAIGKSEPFLCMTYFPVIIKRSHLKLIRDHITRHLNKTNFNEAFAELYQHSTKVDNERRAYSQFNIMCSYLWYHHRDEYYWSIYPMRNSTTDEQTQQATTELEGLNKDLFNRWQPGVSLHWTYEKTGLDLTEVLKTGICYSSPNINENMCDQSIVVKRWHEVNRNEWMFESYDLSEVNSTAALRSHRLRLFENEYCSNMTNGHFNYQEAFSKL